MRAIVLMFDSLNRHMLPPYGDTYVDAPNFSRLAQRAVTFDRFYAGSMPCMPARRELHTGRYNFLHRSWGPLEPFDDSMPEILKQAGVHTHLASDHPHYWEDGGGNYHTRYTTWEGFRGQEGDPWKGVVDQLRGPGRAVRRQDAINRTYMPSEADHSQTRTVDAGIEFLTTNSSADRWMLQLELFDPHEPFFVHEQYQQKYAAADADLSFDWPEYRKVSESPEQIASARANYAALVSMCDHSLGRVLDVMDEHDMWNDTMLIVNTDHGFLLGDHGWWAKITPPWFNELVHLPLFLWDPRTKGADIRRGALAQTIDIAPTLLRYFGLEPTSDMQGRDLATVLDDDRTIHDGALFGIHGGHVNVTDGRYVYMRAPADSSNLPLEEYTLMPAHMRALFTPDELADWVPAAPFSFTKRLRTVQISEVASWTNAWRQGTLLFDLQSDPEQQHPISDPDIELRMLGLLSDLLHQSDAPPSQFDRLGLPRTGYPGVEHTRAASDHGQASSHLEPLPDYAELGMVPELTQPLLALLDDAASRLVLHRHLPEATHTELLGLPAALSLVDLAASDSIPAATLRAIAEDFSQLRHTH